MVESKSYNHKRNIAEKRIKNWREAPRNMGADADNILKKLYEIIPKYFTSTSNINL